MADAQFIPLFVRDRLRRPVCGTHLRPLPPDSAKGLQTKEKALISLRALEQFRLTQKLCLTWQTCFCEVSLLPSIKTCHWQFLPYAGCGLLCAYRNKITEDLKEKLSVKNIF